MIRTAFWCHQAILHQSKTGKQSKIKHQPQRCHAAHAVLAELFTSIWVFFRTVCTRQVLSVFPHPYHSSCTLGMYSYWLCYTPSSQGASSSVIQYGNGFCCTSCISGKLTKVKTFSSPASIFFYYMNILTYTHHNLLQNISFAIKKKCFHTVIAVWGQVVLQS